MAGSYSPTSWVDGVAPAIDAANLLKLEHGVRDAYTQAHQVFNVLDVAYGAKGDGATDDTAAVQAAATAAAGAVLYLPPSSSFYKVTSPITIPDNTRVVGSWGGGYWNAAKSVVKKTNGDTNGNAVFLVGANCLIENVSFQGPDTVYYLASSYPAGTNNPSYGCYGNTSGSAADGTRFSNCSFDFFKAAGIGGPFNIATVDNCVFRSNLFGIDWTNADGAVFRSIFQHNVHSGFRTSANYNRLIGNRFEWNARYGAVMGDLTVSHVGGAQALVNGNLFDRNGWSGLVLWNWHYVVSGNLFTRNGAGGDGSLGITETSPFDNQTITPTTGHDSAGNLIYLAPAAEADKCHIQVNAAKYGVIAGNHFLRGHDDSGTGGAFSPKYIYTVTASDHCVIEANQETAGWAGAVSGDAAYGDGAGALWYNGGSGSFEHAGSGGFQTLTYGATVTTDALTGKVFFLAVTNGTAFTIAKPTNGTAGQQITYDIWNNSGGAMGAITWASGFLLAGAFTNPANTKQRTITFVYDGTTWIEASRAAADI